jgi:hypothetical protein
MKVTTLIKKLFVIAVLGGFCMPAQAMKRFIEKHIYTKSNEEPKKLTLADYLKQEKFFNVRNSPERCVLLRTCYEKAGRKVDGVDAYGHTALYYAIAKRDVAAIYELLLLGANINSIMVEDKKSTIFSMLKLSKDSIAKKEAEAFDLLNEAFVPRSDFYNQLVANLPDYSFMRRLALFAKNNGIIEATYNSLRTNVSSYFLSVSDPLASLILFTMQNIEFDFFNPASQVVIDKDLMDRAQEIWQLNSSGPLFRVILGSCDIKNIQRFIPVLVSNKELRERFYGELEKFKCQEYKEEIGRMFVAEKNKNVMCGMLTNKKLVDAQWRFV